MEYERKKSLPLASWLNWFFVLLWMGVIFLFSSQGSDQSAELSTSVMDVSAFFINHWQRTFLLVILAVTVLYVIWAYRRAESARAWLVYGAIYLYFCLLGVLALWFIVRPFYLNSNLHNYNYWTVHNFFRKYAHLFIYFVLGILVKNALTYSNVRGFKAVAVAILICCLYAVSDEIHQYFVPGRTALIMDVWIDTLGASIGILLYTIVDALCGDRTIWQAYWNL